MKYKLSVFGDSMFRTLMVYILVNIILLANIIRFKSPTLGFIASVIYIYISSVLCGNILFKDEVSWTRILLGFSGFITLLSVGEAAPLILYKLTSNVVVLVMMSISSVLVILTLKQRGFKKIFRGEFIVSNEASDDAEKPKHSALITMERLAVVAYTILAVASFLLLISSRSEEVRVVWDSVHPAFLPSYFLATFALLIVILSKVSKKIKISFVIIHSFLAHSILIFVFDQIISGDPWHELGRIRDILTFGNDLPNFFGWISSGYSPIAAVYYSVRRRAFHGLLVTFSQMFSVDVNWIMVFLMPVLSSILIPLLTYKIVEVAGGKGNTPIFGALLTLAVPWLVWWSAITVADTFGLIFFCLMIYLVLKYFLFGEMKFFILVFIFVVIFAAFSTHFRDGVIAITVFVLAFGFRRYESLKTKSVAWANILLLLAFLVGSALLPFALFGLYGAYPETGEMHVYFDVRKLLGTDALSLLFGDFVNYSFKELLPSVAVVFIGISGLIYVFLYASKKKYRYSQCLFLLLLLAYFFVDYRILKYAMANVPFSPERMWIETFWVIIPFAAIMISGLLRVSLKSGRVVSTKFHKFGVLKSGMIVFVFCLGLSGLFTLAAQRGYAEGVTPPLLNVTSYEVEAINYLHKNTPGKYAVMSDPIFATTAYGVLGFQSRGEYFRYSDEYYQMLENPSEKPLIDVLGKTDASLVYFVISNRTYGFEDVVEQTQRVLETYAVFGDGHLYVFRYPASEQQQFIPLTVDAGNYSRRDYPVQFKLNFTEMLLQRGRGRNLDPNSVRVIGTDGEEVESQIDDFQAWFDDCSTSAYLSNGISNGDVLNYTLPFIGKAGNIGGLTYTKLERDGGDLTINPRKYRYIEVKWRTIPSRVSSIRIDLWYKVGNGIEVWTPWAFPSSEWTVWHYDLSLWNGTLYGLQLDIFSESSKWVGNYTLQIDWIRFISDCGTLRFLYSGADHTTEKYRVFYDFLENTESGKMDGLPKRVYPNPIRSTEESNQYSFTWDWGDRKLHFLLGKNASEWVGTPGKSFSYVLKIDDSNILTSNSYGLGGLGVMQNDGSSSGFNISFSNATLISDGPIMAEIRYQTNEYGSLHIQLYKGQHPRIFFFSEKEELSAVGASFGESSWLISTNSSDNKIYYMRENGEVASEDLSGNISTQNWQAQSVGQYEVHGYLIVVSSLSNTVGNYSANYNELGLAELDFLSYVHTGSDDVDVEFFISESQSLEEMRNTTLELKNPPTVSVLLPIDLTVKTVDLLGEPLSNVEVKVKELGMQSITDSEGLAHFVVYQGQWTLIASKAGITSEKTITVSANYITLQKLNLARIEGLVINWWQFALSALLIVIGSSLLLLLIRTKITGKWASK